MRRFDKWVAFLERREQRLSVLHDHTGEENHLAFFLRGVDPIRALWPPLGCGHAINKTIINQLKKRKIMTTS